MYPREYFDTFWRGDLKKEVFVIMSFAAEFTPVWEGAIKPAIEDDIGLAAHRVDASVLAGSIITEIMEGVAHAKVVFADVSTCTSGIWKGQRNGNAMYEVGLTHALRQPSETVMVRCDEEPINFDIAGIKVQKYDRYDTDKARELFANLTKGALEQTDRTKALMVERAADSLDVDCIEVMNATGSAEYFSVEPAGTHDEILDRMVKKSAVGRLLTLGIVRCDYDHATRGYAYHWTNMGKHVLQRLKIR